MGRVSIDLAILLRDDVELRLRTEAFSLLHFIALADEAASALDAPIILELKLLGLLHVFDSNVAETTV